MKDDPHKNVDKLMNELLENFRKNPLKGYLQVDARRDRINEWYKERYGQYPDGEGPREHPSKEKPPK
jgi:hypothetical protein